MKSFPQRFLIPRTQHISHDRISVFAIRRMAQVAFITSADPFQTASETQQVLRIDTTPQLVLTTDVDKILANLAEIFT